MPRCFKLPLAFRSSNQNHIVCISAQSHFGEKNMRVDGLVYVSRLFVYVFG